MKVLICEADPTIVLDLWCLLHGQGHAICGMARSCSRCLETIARTRPDLVVVDVDVAEGEGSGHPGLVEVLAQLGIPSIVLASDDQTLLPPAASVQVVLKTPFNEAMLAIALAQVERRNRLQWSAG